MQIVVVVAKTMRTDHDGRNTTREHIIMSIGRMCIATQPTCLFVCLAG